MVLQLPLCLLFLAACLRVLFRWRKTPGEVVLFHGIVCGLWLTAMLVVPLFRYLAPAFPLVMFAMLWQLADLQRDRVGSEEAV
jgi:hypothetical protein